MADLLKLLQLVPREAISSPGIFYKQTADRCRGGMAPFLPLEIQDQSSKRIGSWFGVQNPEEKNAPELAYEDVRRSMRAASAHRVLVGI